MAHRKFKLDHNGLQVNESEHSVYVGVTKHQSAPADRPFAAYASVPPSMVDIVRDYSKSTGFYAGLTNSVLIGYYADERDAAFVAQDFRDPEHLEDNLNLLAEGRYTAPTPPEWETPPLVRADLKVDGKTIAIADVADAFRYLIPKEARHIVGVASKTRSAIRTRAERLAKTVDPLSAARQAIAEIAPAS
jgi:hypothetical protein